MGYFIAWALGVAITFPFLIWFKRKLVWEGEYDNSNKEEFKENLVFNLICTVLSLVWPIGIPLVLFVTAPEWFEMLVDWWFESRQKEPNADA